MNVIFYLSYDIKITLKSHLWSKKIKILSLYTQCCYEHHYIMLQKSILMHGDISLQDVRSCDKIF